ncbi:MAG: hypothetical protein GEV28_23205 [Actinophytocola sp.]|uniref:hypothetical protein n=1 Tax=Actinophytocola sp. TaxID=1872138 RepID=UPI001329ED3B|nr:hypothetical protein [Actinophytocola sp.]MPZ83138.1 hypothetical protein [Actinophytocola sp.]
MITADVYGHLLPEADDAIRDALSVRRAAMGAPAKVTGRAEVEQAGSGQPQGHRHGPGQPNRQGRAEHRPHDGQAKTDAPAA